MALKSTSTILKIFNCIHPMVFFEQALFFFEIIFLKDEF